MGDIAIVAPFWADVDTRGMASGLAWYKSIGNNAFVVVYEKVGFYDSRSDLLNTFSVVISDGTYSPLGMGNTACFCYQDMQWTTGEASDGIDGFGGEPATVGANRGVSD